MKINNKLILKNSNGLKDWAKKITLRNIITKFLTNVLKSSFTKKNLPKVELYSSKMCSIKNQLTEDSKIDK